MNRLARRPKLIDACATIARAVSVSGSGAAHTVQLMLRDPEFRQSAIETALAHHTPATGVELNEQERRCLDGIRAAVALLAPHTGSRL